MFFNKIWKFIVALLSLDYETWAFEYENTLVESIISSRNSSVKPCEDFYSYACGNYAQQHSSNDYHEITSYMDYKFNSMILKLIETKYQHDHQVVNRCQSFVEKTRVYFKSCRSETKRNLTKYFEQIKPGPQLNWPIIQQWAKNTEEPPSSYQWSDSENFDVWPLLGKLQSYGMNNVLINQEILIDGDGEINIMVEPAVSENNSTLPDTSVLYGLLIILGVKNPAKIIQNLEKTNKLLLYILENYGAADQENLEITYDQLESLYPHLNLGLYLNELMSRELPADTLILIRNPSYFQHLNKNMWLVFDKQKLCNYLMMKFAFFLAVDSTEEFNSMACIKDLRNKFDLAVNFLFYHHDYEPQAHHVEPDIEHLFVNIAMTLCKYFKKNKLNLSDSQVQFLADKLQNMRLNIGNLPDGVNFDLVEEFYINVPALDKNNYYKNHLLMLKHRFAKSLHYVQNQTFFIAPDNTLGSSSGAFYVAKQNMIILPFGSLMQPMYDYHYHDLYKYSLLGFILAHELTHAFDTYGLNFNSQGQISIQNTSILHNENFANSIDCLQFQLATDSIDERIADIVAIQIVYKMYVSKYNNLQPASLCYNWNPYFFLTLAQFFCGKENIKFIDHDTDAQRLNQIVMNSRGFAKAFGCPDNSAMNPKEKCRVY